MTDPDEQDWLRSLDWWQETLRWQPSQTQRMQFQQLYTQLIQLNREVNLTRITTPEDFLEKHLWDSLWGVQPWLLQENLPALQVIDIGTGGGFPGCPVAIVQSQWNITLLDATRKKIDCLERLCQTLELSQVKCLCDRAEALGQMPQYRESFDLALIRAVDLAPVCAEYALPFLTIDGIAALYRGQWTMEEEKSLTLALQKLGGEIQDVKTIHTPLSQSVRHCIYVQKNTSTSAEYPRRVGVPSRRPLEL